MLDDPRAVPDITTGYKVTDLERDQITAAQLAVDCEA
jgi:hypothetical protein